MISGIQSVLLPIFDYVDSFFGWWIDAFTGLVNLVSYLKIAVDYAYDFVDWVPVQVKAVLFVCFGIAVAYKIIGREG